MLLSAAKSSKPVKKNRIKRVVGVVAVVLVVLFTILAILGIISFVEWILAEITVAVIANIIFRTVDKPASNRQDNPQRPARFKNWHQMAIILIFQSREQFLGVLTRSDYLSFSTKRSVDSSRAVGALVKHL
jgi:hypothetical protein